MRVSCALYLDEGGFFDVVQFDSQMALLQPRAHEHCVGGVRTQRTQPFGVLSGFDVVDQLQIGEVVADSGKGGE